MLNSAEDVHFESCAVTTTSSFYGFFYFIFFFLKDGCLLHEEIDERKQIVSHPVLCYRESERSAVSGKHQ